MELTMIRALYGYHWWANRRLFDVTVTLGDATAAKELGPQFSVPTLKGMFAHILGADAGWLARWKGGRPTKLMGDADFPTLADLRACWDTFEAEQRAYVEGLSAADLATDLEYYDTRGNRHSAPVWQMLQHVANHATHHRSEIATMLTMVSGSPPSTDLIAYQRLMQTAR
jgi:uncharacterized damage-inducible protein DinB